MLRKATSVDAVPSEEKKWLQYYPPQLLATLSHPEATINEYLKDHLPGMDVPAIHYYGNDITWQEVFDKAWQVAKSLKALGFKEGDDIPVFLRLTPEYVYLLLGAEIIGAALLCRDNTIQENAEAVAKTSARYIFANDFLTKEDFGVYRKQAKTRFAITISPYESAVFTDMPEHIHDYIDSLYDLDLLSGPRTMTWKEFLKLGDDYHGEVEAPRDIYRPLLKCYTSGSTGPSKQVIHCAHSIIGTLSQMNFYGGSDEFRPTWLTTHLPPALVAVVVSMTLMPLASNKLLIMDPFCAPEDVDLEIMRYRPNCWPSIPMFFEILIGNGRIPADFDMSFLFSTGVGCEAYNNTQIRRAQKFLDDHHSNATLTSGYGSSEAGSNITFHMDNYPMKDGKVGIPMPFTTMGIFRPGTQEELGYWKTGEICVKSPGNMLGYDDPRATRRTLQTHADGSVWLHTGDIGYVNEDGVFYTITRGSAPRFGYRSAELATLPMENKLADAEIKGIVDQFFVIAPDPEHAHHFLPYLYVVLDEGFELKHVENQIYKALDRYMYPVEITVLKERPFWHFKTNRIGLTEELHKNNYNSLR